MSVNARSIAVSLVAFAILAGLWFLPDLRGRSLRHEATVTLPDGAAYRVEIADTEAEWNLGLGTLPKLGEDEGMLFLSPLEPRPIFWMKDMRFSIDIVWLKKEVGSRKSEVVERFEIVDRIERAPVPADPAHPNERYLPEADADAVLELPAGAFAAHGLANGSRLDLVNVRAGYR